MNSAPSPSRTCPACRSLAKSTAARASGRSRRKLRSAPCACGPGIATESDGGVATTCERDVNAFESDPIHQGPQRGHLSVPSLEAAVERVCGPALALAAAHADAEQIRIVAEVLGRRERDRVDPVL